MQAGQGRAADADRLADVRVVLAGEFRRSGRAA
jgi:hypothetical protein